MTAAFLLDFMCATAVPITESNTYVSSMEYSPLIGGFAITLNDGRAAYLTANSLKFDPNVSRLMMANAKPMGVTYPADLLYVLFAASARNLGSRIGRRNVCKHKSQIQTDRFREEKVRNPTNRTISAENSFCSSPLSVADTTSAPF